MLSRARRLWREARGWPLFRSLAAAADRAWWAHVIRRADVVDVAFVSAQLGRSVSARAAVRTYVKGGFARGLSLNPLFSEKTVSRQLPDPDRVPALYAYLVNDPARLAVSPNWDAPEYVLRHPEALDDPAGPLGHQWRSGEVLLGRDGAERTLSRELVSGTAVAAAGGSRAVGSPSPPAADLGFVCLIAPDESFSDRALALAASLALRGADTEVVLQDPPSVQDRVDAHLLTLWLPGVRVREVADLTAVEPTVSGRTILVRGPHAVLALEDALRLAAAGAERPTAPLWLDTDGTIASAGLIVHDERLIDLLAGHPVEDAAGLGSEIAITQAAGRTRAWPRGRERDAPRTLLSATVTAPRTASEPRTADAPDTDLAALLRPAGLEVAGWRRSGSTPVPSLARSRTVLEDGSLRLRWAIKTAAPAGPDGESWGDTHFARGIAAALRRLGQEVVVDAYPARARATGYLDDVTLVLRGPRRIEPPPSGRSILWIISHPDEISAEEASGFDIVFAASRPWATTAAATFGRPVHPLLQCTDTAIFHPRGLARTDRVVFVGTARGIARPSVVEPLRHGIPVSVYGPDWRGFIPASAIVATGVPNSELGELYEQAAIVLNDHWPAMRDAGFISNRPYDVIAAGGRVISDAVEGMEQEFSGAVAVYHSIPELIRMLESDHDVLFPPPARLAEIGALVRERDSFDARARTLLDAAS